jgi:hypothetical protein
MKDVRGALSSQPQTGDVIIVCRDRKWQAQRVGTAPAVIWPTYERAVESLGRFAGAVAVDVWKSQADGTLEPVVRHRRPSLRVGGA